jgi:hypothetical protein
MAKFKNGEKRPDFRIKSEAVTKSVACSRKIMRAPDGWEPFGILDIGEVYEGSRMVPMVRIYYKQEIK